MKKLTSLFKVSFWTMLLPALALHGAILNLPFSRNTVTEKDKAIDDLLSSRGQVQTVKLLPTGSPTPPPVRVPPPKPQPTLKAPAAHSASSTQGGQPTPVPASSLGLAPSPQTPTPVQAATVASPPAAIPPSPPSVSPTPVSSASAPTAVPSRDPTSDPLAAESLQLTNALSGCNGMKSCYALTETNGRAVFTQLEQRLVQKGYALEKLELDDDVGMSVYKLSRDGKVQDYLHLLWTDHGTTYLRSPKVLSRRELSELATQS